MVTLGYTVKDRKSLLANAAANSFTENVSLSCDQALVLLEASQSAGPSLELYEGVFKPFMLVMQEKKVQPTILALELLSKLFEYGYWSMNINGIQGFIGLLTETISACFVGEQTDQKIQTLVLKTLAAAISVNDSDACLHGSPLLKSVRVMYNIFLLSKSPTVQTIAQATITQIASSVFSRIPEAYSYKEIMASHQDKLAKRKRAKSNTSQTEPLGSSQNIIRSSSRILADNDKESGEFDEPANFSHLSQVLGERVSTARDSQDILRDAEGEQSRSETVYDVLAKDAYLLLRAFCKLAMKQIPDGGTDLKSQHMRSKILSLSLIYDALKTFKHIFFYPSPILFTSSVQAETVDDVRFIVATKHYLCMSITRNIVSIVPQVFDVSIDILGRIMLDLRLLMKHEIGVMLTQIVIPIIESTTPVTFYQRVSCMKSLQRTFGGPEGGKLLVELYLNYDCDPSSSAEENVWERLIAALAQIMTNSLAEPVAEPPSQFTFSNSSFSVGNGPAITTSNLQNYTKEQIRQLYLPTGDSIELRKSTTELIVKGILLPLYTFCKEKIKLEEEKSHSKTVDMADDQVTSFEISKNKKVRLAEGIKLFNRKPKTAIRFLVDAKIIPSKAPRHVAHFLLNCPGLEKSMIGEYLGEGDESNIQTMHAFVDVLDFSGLSFVNGLRKFLQTFRLPGEAQKIDRFMLKFAARYLAGNPDSFSSADTAYILAYSTIMLNTDQHNPQVKRRMTCEDFIKNNRGIDEGKDLSVTFLEKIFDEIKANEIKMKDEEIKPTANTAESPAFKNIPKKSASTKMLQNDLYNSIRLNHGTTRDTSELDVAFRSVEPSVFTEALHHGHVKPMFQMVWMSFLMVCSSTLQKTDVMNTIITALEGFKYAIHTACIFELELEKKGFLSNLGKFLDVPNLLESKDKNVEACKMLLEIAYIDGNFFNDNWQMVVKCISDIEKIQSAGLIEPDSTKTSDQRRRDTRHMEDIYANINSQAVTLSVDRIFSSSSKLNAQSIIYFVRALCEMSWDEIISSSDREHPRMYCLQKLIEVCHYNVNVRIRIEWNQIWNVIGPHINQVGCHSNSNVVYFCLDKLRQFATKFLDLNELPNFKFQKDFLRPFLFIFENNPDSKIKDMVLTCANQMILHKAYKLKSGWKTIFLILASAAQEPQEAIVRLGFSISSTIHKEYLDLVMSQNFYSDFVAAMTKYCHGQKFPKINAQAVTILRQGAERANQGKNVPAPPSNPIAGANENLHDPGLKVWMVTFKNMKNVIMTCELEVRNKALIDLFEVLGQNGHQFNQSFWTVILKEILLPLFSILDIEPMNRPNTDESNIWISTTLVSALTHLVDLYSAFPILTTIAIDPILDLLMNCILQENDTLAKLGSNCIVDYVEKNCTYFSESNWDNICNRLIKLMVITRPNELFFELDNGEENTSPPLGLAFAPKPSRKQFPKIIVKCVLHLLVIQTLHKILNSQKRNEIYGALSQRHVFKLGDCFYDSFQFAKSFNMNNSLRQALHQMGFMKQVPNLIKQETSAVACYLVLLSRMFSDKSPQQALISREIERRLIPLSYKLLDQYLQFDLETQQSSISAWTPAIESILSGFTLFQDHHFEEFVPSFYNFFVKLIGRHYFHSLLEPIFFKIGSLYRIPLKKLIIPEVIERFPSLESVVDDELEKVASALVESSMRYSTLSLSDEDNE